jgi:hypothetical protein
MTAGASDPHGPTSSSATGLSSGRGRLLSPITAGVLRQALQHYLASDPEFVGEFFPNLASRGHSAYDDVFSLTQRQAEALVPILESSVRYYQRLDHREQSRAVHLIERKPAEPSSRSSFGQKAELWARSLRDLCDKFDVICPM